MKIKRLWLLARVAWRESGRDNASQMASAIAYRVLFAIVPLTMFVVSVIGLIAGSDQRQDEIVDEITQYLRLSEGEVTLGLSEAGFARISEEYGAEQAKAVDEALAGLSGEEEDQLAQDIDAGKSVDIAGVTLEQGDVAVTSDNLVVETLRGVVDASGPVSIISFVILAFSASGLFASVRRSLDFIWGMRVARPMFQGKAFDLVMLFAVMAIFILVIVALGIGSALRAVGNADDSWLTGTLIWGLSSTAASWFVTFGVCAAAFRYIPQVRTRFRDIWLGAAVVATGFEVLKFAASIYVANFNSFDLVYGALGGVLLFLLLVYWAAYIFLIGAEVAAEYPRVRAGEYDELDAGTGEKQPLRDMLTGAVKGLFVRDGTRERER
jgi:membrane protein